MKKSVPMLYPGSQIDWTTLIFMASYHLLLLVTLPIYLIAHTPNETLIGFTVFLIVGSLLSITAGYHRLYTHRTYRVRKPVEWILLFFGTLTIQGSVIRWAHDHRKHHSHLDTAGDPYGTARGFWYSHMLWMFKKSDALDVRYLGDLQENRLLAFQHRHYVGLMASVNIGAFLAAGWLANDFAGAFVIALLLRVFLVHHSTWFINSLAHLWGSKPYSTEHSAVNNFILSLLTYGEGYHNFHHTFASDFRNGIKWYQFDPPKYLIWTMNKVGLAWDLKQADPLMIEKRLILADRKLLFEHLDEVSPIEATAFRGVVDSMSLKLTETFVSAKNVMDRYRSLQGQRHNQELKELQDKVHALKRGIRQDLKTWRRLCNLVLDIPTGNAALERTL